MVYVVRHSWNIPYAMKTLLIYANEGFGRGFNTKLHCFSLDYMHVVEYLDNGSGQDGVVNDPWNGGKQTLSVGFSSLGFHFGMFLWVICTICLFGFIIHG